MASAIPKKVRSHRSFNLVSVAVRVLFVAAIVSAVAAFGYKYYLERDLSATQQALSDASQKFNQAQLDGVVAFDEKLNIAQSLLDAHLSPSKIFTALEEKTKASIQYTSFDYIRSSEGVPSITIDGVTDDFGKVALQKLQYASSPLLAGVVVTKVSLDVSGGAEDAVKNMPIHFSLTATLSGADVAYDAPYVAPIVIEESAAATTTASTTESTIPASTTATSSNNGTQ